MLTAVRDNNEKGTRYMLDFSHVNGGVQEYIPPQNWPVGDSYRRMLYSLSGEASAKDYKRFLPLPENQASTPYKMGKVPFYCMIDGHYCAGIVGIDSPAYIEVWINEKEKDQTLRYID